MLQKQTGKVTSLVLMTRPYNKTNEKHGNVSSIGDNVYLFATFTVVKPKMLSGKKKHTEQILNHLTNVLI